MRLNEQGVELVRRDLCELRDIERQMSTSRRRLKASKLGELTMNPKEFNQLKQHLVYWQGRLGDDLGGYPNPFGSGVASGLSSRNAKVC